MGPGDAKGIHQGQGIARKERDGERVVRGGRIPGAPVIEDNDAEMIGERRKDRGAPHVHGRGKPVDQDERETGTPVLIRQGDAVHVRGQDR